MFIKVAIVICIFVAIVATAEKSAMLRHSDSFADFVDELNDYEEGNSFHRFLEKVLRYLPPKRAAAVNGEKNRLEAQQEANRQARQDKIDNNRHKGDGTNAADTRGPGLVGCTQANLKATLTNIHKAAGSAFTGNSATVTDAANHISVDYHYDTLGRPTSADVTFLKDWKKCGPEHRDSNIQSKFTSYFVKSGFTNTKMTGTGAKKEHPQVHVDGQHIDAGHIVANQLCGPNNILNFVPQTSPSNNGAWKSGETALVKFLESAKGKQCEVKAKMSYTYGTTGPTSVTHANPANCDPIAVNDCLKLIWPTNLQLELVSITKKGTAACPALPANKVLVSTKHQKLRLLDLLNELQNENNDVGREKQSSNDFDVNDLERELESLLY